MHPFRASAVPTGGLALVPGVILTLALGAPPPVSAQTCLGSPALPGQYTLGAGVGFSEGSTAYTLRGGANLEGPLAFESHLGTTRVDDLENDVFVAGGIVGYQLPVQRVLLCPFSGFGHSVWSERIDGIRSDFSELTFPLGVSFGRLFGGSDAAAIVPAAGAGLLYRRLRRAVAGAPGAGEEETDTDIELLFQGGAALVVRQLFVRAGLSRTTIQDAGTVLTVDVGIRLGG